MFAILMHVPIHDSIAVSFQVVRCPFPSSHMQVNSNGILSFDDRFTEYRQTPFPIDSPPLIALFWDDFDPTAGGQISYRLTNDSDELLLLHRLLLCVDVEDIDENFYPEQIFIATWDRVRPYSNSPAINSEVGHC